MGAGFEALKTSSFKFLPRNHAMTRAEVHLQRREKKKARRAVERQAHRRCETAPVNRGKAMVRELYKTVHHFFPELF